MFHGIHTIFPPPRKTGHDGQDPIHQKKAKNKGSWEFVKEILGWVFHGIDRCIKLPNPKIATLKELTANIGKRTAIKTKDLESIKGKMQHATIGMPGATPL